MGVVITSRRFNNCAAGDDDILGDDHDPVAHEPVRAVLVDAGWEGLDHHVASYPGILIDDGVFNAGVLSDADARFA